MNEDDYRDLIRFVEGQLVDVGAAEVADERHYLRDDDEGSARLLPPEAHFIELLKAFERYLAVRDGSSVVQSLNKLREMVAGDPINRILVERPATETVRDDINLSNLPDLSEQRLALKSLIERLQYRGGLTLG